MSTIKTNTTESSSDDINALKIALSEKDRIIVKMALRIALLEEYNRLEKIRRFTSSSEKSADQQEMFNEAEFSEAIEEVLAEAEEKADQKKEESESTKTKPGRKPLPAELPRIRIEHDIQTAKNSAPAVVNAVLSAKTSVSSWISFQPSFRCCSMYVKNMPVNTVRQV